MVKFYRKNNFYWYIHVLMGILNLSYYRNTSICCIYTFYIFLGNEFVIFTFCILNLDKQFTYPPYFKRKYEYCKNNAIFLGKRPYLYLNLVHAAFLYYTITFRPWFNFCTIWCYDIILLTDRNLFSIVRDPYFSGNIEGVHGRFVSWYWRQWFSHFGCIGLNNYFYLWLVFCLTVTLLFLCLSAYKWQQVRYRLHICTSANIDDVSVYRGFLVVV